MCDFFMWSVSSLGLCEERSLRRLGLTSGLSCFKVELRRLWPDIRGSGCSPKSISSKLSFSLSISGTRLWSNGRPFEFWAANDPSSWASLLLTLIAFLRPTWKSDPLGGFAFFVFGFTDLFEADFSWFSLLSITFYFVWDRERVLILTI